MVGDEERTVHGIEGAWLAMSWNRRLRRLHQSVLGRDQERKVAVTRRRQGVGKCSLRNSSFFSCAEA